MLLVQVRLIPLYRRAPFGPGYWAFSFPLAAAVTGLLDGTFLPRVAPRLLVHGARESQGKLRARTGCRRRDAERIPSTRSEGIADMDVRLEVVVLPVADVDGLRISAKSSAGGWTPTSPPPPAGYPGRTLTGAVTAGDRSREPRGDRLLVATGRRPRLPEGLDTVGITAGRHGIPVDSRTRAGERLWAVGDVTGLWLLTHVGKYQGEIVAANILGEPREAHYDAVPRVVYTYPQAASVGENEAVYSGTALLADVAKTATYTHAIHARVPLPVLRDTIQPFPAFTEIYVDALKALHTSITAAHQEQVAP
jgi:hypothetical protein